MIESIIKQQFFWELLERLGHIMKNRTMQWKNREHLGRIGLCVGLVLLFCCLGFAPALASVLELPSALTQIADEAFMNDTAITSVVIPDGATSIGARAFAGCGNLIGEVFSQRVGNTQNAYTRDWDNVYKTVISAGRSDPDYATVLGTNLLGEVLQVQDEVGGWFKLIAPADGDYYFFVDASEIDADNFRIEIYSYGVKTASFLANNQNGIQAFVLQNVSAGEELTWWDNDNSGRGYTFLEPFKLMVAYHESAIDNAFVLPDTIEYIGNNAFEDCASLTKVVIPEGVTNISDSAFENCSKDFAIVGTIGSYAEEYAATNGFRFLTTYQPNVLAPDGLEYEVYDTYAVITGYTGTETELILPDKIKGVTVTEIGTSAFQNCSSIVRISLPDSLTTIQGSAFRACVNLSEIVLPEGVTHVSEYAFYGCSNLRSVSLPKTVEIIYRYAFSNCTSLTDIELSEGLKTIYSFAFSECTSLVSIALPNSIETMGAGAFLKCTKLSDVNYPSGWKEVWNYYNNKPTHSNWEYWYSPFHQCTSLKNIVVPEGVTVIPNNAFDGIDNLITVELPSTLKTIEDFVFYWAGIRYVYIPPSVTEVGDYAFAQCHNLESVYIPPSVKSIGTGAFYESAGDAVIFGEPGSYAETYAAENGIAFSTAPFPGTETEPDEETVTLSGSVTFADGTPVEDAYIYVYDTIAEDWIGLEYTDRNGAWACSVPADGSYTIHYLHDVYTIAPAEVSISPAADMTLDTAIASLVGGEGTATPVFVMQMNGAEIPAEGVKVGDIVTFSITAEGATKVRLVADGVAYNEYWLTNGSVTIERSFTRAGTRQIAFQAYDGRDWGAVCEAQTLIVTADGTLDAPVIHAIDTQYVGESFTVTWDAVENAESYTVYLYRNELLWPALSNTDRSTTAGLSMEIPGDLLYTDGEYLIEIIASGYGYSQSSASVKFTVEETAAGVEITYPTDGMTYSIGDTMHTRYAMGSGTQGVRLLVAPPVGEPVLYAPDESGIFYPIADQVGDYVLTPYYSMSEGDFTAETADGAGESVTVTVQKPAISSLTQGTNKQYSIRYTGTAQDFAGSVSNARYTVKVYLNDALVQELVPEDGEFAFTTDTLTETGKYVYAFVPCYGDIEGEPKEFPVYMVEQELDSVTKYAGEPMMLLGAPDGSVKASLAYGAEVTILGTYSEEYLYVSANGKDGFIAAGSKLVEALEPSEMDINVECLTDVPYTKLGENRQYKITVNGAKTVYANLMQENVSVGIYEGEAVTDGFIVTIPAEDAGAYIAAFYAVTMDEQVAYYVCDLPLLMVDASGTNVGKECWSNHSKMLLDAMSIYTRDSAEFDVTTCKMHVVGTINNDLVCVQRTMNDGSVKYAVVNKETIQYTKNITTYHAIGIINPYDEYEFDGDRCERNLVYIDRAFALIDKLDRSDIYVRGGREIDIGNAIWTKIEEVDYNDITYIYWSGHGVEENPNETGYGIPAYQWSILPKMDGDLDPKTPDEYLPYYYSQLISNLSELEGKMNLILDSCFSGDFVTELEKYQRKNSVNFSDRMAILMSTQMGQKGLSTSADGSLFTKELAEYVVNTSDVSRTLSNVAENIRVSGYRDFWSAVFEIEENKHYPIPTIWGDPNRIFFAEDPDAVN